MRSPQSVSHTSVSCVYSNLDVLQLTKCKECCEQALEAKTMPQQIVMECLGIREQRSNIDLVADVTESELKKVYGL